MKKGLKIVLIIILLILICFVIFNVKDNKELKNKGYSDDQISKFYDLDFDIDTLLSLDYCKNIDSILNKSISKDELVIFLNSCQVEPSVPNDSNDNETPVEPNEPEEPKEDPFVTSLKQAKYYIPDNLDRYIAYNDGTKEIDDIIRDVNCNIDYDFYTNTKPSDLTKGYLLLVNKYNYIDETYVPNNKTLLVKGTYSLWDDAYLEKVAYDAFKKLIDDSKSLGYNLIDTSPYRSFEYQSYLYNTRVNNEGVAAADRLSARPGFSEHQTGLATDIIKNGVSMYSFGETKEFEWLKDNAHKYGFILRYPKGKEYLTGYDYEPWHYRYVGIDVATYIYENDLVYEEYYAYFCEYKNEC